MKKLLLGALLLLSMLSFSQTDIVNKDTLNVQLKRRYELVTEMNNSCYLSFGNNDIMYYECNDTFTTITLTLTEKFFTKMGGASKNVRKKTGETLLEQYNYFFLKEGFDVFNIKVEGIELISKKLKLNR